MIAILRSIYPYLFLFFCFVLPLDKYATSVPNIVLIAMLIAFPFVVKKYHFLSLFRREVILFAVFIFYVVVNNFLFHDFNEDFTIIKKIISALLLVVLAIPIERTENLKKTVIASVVVCILISLYHLYFFYMREGEFNFAFGGEINEVLIIDRLYLGFLCVISIIASIGLIGNKYNEYNKWYVANIVLCSGFVLLISSRVAILLLILLFLLKIFYTKSKKEYILFFIGIAGLVAVAFILNHNLSKRFFYTHSTQQELGYIGLLKKMEPRFVIWDCNYRIAKDGNALFNGLGFYETKDQLVACYDDLVVQERRREYFKDRRFNSHNQFVGLLLSTGILGVVLFSMIFILFFLRKWRFYFATALLVAMVSFASIESFFHRQLGAYYFGIVLVFLIMESKNSTTAMENNKT